MDDRLGETTPTRRMTAMVMTIVFVAVVLLVMALAMKQWAIDGTP